MSAGPAGSVRRFRARRLARLVGDLADARRAVVAAESKARAMEVRLEVGREDPAGLKAFDERRKACRALGLLRRRGWRVLSDGRWIDPETRRRFEFGAAVHELARAGGRAGDTR